MGLIDSLKNGAFFKRSVKGAFASLHSLLKGSDNGEPSPHLKALLVLIGGIAWADGAVDHKELDAIKDLLPEGLSPRQGSNFLHHLPDNHGHELDEALAALSVCSDVEKRDIVGTLANIAFSSGYWRPPQEQLLTKIAAAFGITEEQLKLIRLTEEQAYQRRERILRSGAGVLVALVIIGIFVLTATFLKALLFGFVLAYLCLPLEKCFEKWFLHPGPVMKVLCSGGVLLAPLYRMSARLRKQFGGGKTQPTAEQKKQEQLNRCVGRAVAATIATLMLVGLIFFAAVSTISANYLAGLSKNIKSWADHQVEVEHQKSPDTRILPKNNVVKNDYLDSLLSASIRKLDEFKRNIEKWPLTQYAVNEITDSLKDSNNQKDLLNFVLKKTSGFFSLTADFLTNTVSLLFHSLMTMFFFLLFLQKMALYTAKRNHKEAVSEYVVKAIFESSWMPSTGEETRAQARKILEEIGLMLKTWLRGYLAIIAIETTSYITIFSLLGVPYAFILGFLAGCTVMLPYIGPVGSAVLTLLVTLALGHPSVLLLLAIVLTYIIITGIIDQFFTYPWFVGNALGLNQLETISVVLLGGVFAGLSGMIFAVPAASVLKYLVPKIYYCWRPGVSDAAPRSR